MTIATVTITDANNSEFKTHCPMDSQKLYECMVLSMACVMLNFLVLCEETGTDGKAAMEELLKHSREAAENAKVKLKEIQRGAVGPVQ